MTMGEPRVAGSVPLQIDPRPKPERGDGQQNEEAGRNRGEKANRETIKISLRFVATEGAFSVPLNS